MRLIARLNGLWRHPDFLRLWSGQTISVFGSMVGGTAMSFTAILFLNATPFQIGLINAMQVLPAFLAGLFAGAWVDRVRRRPLMIGVDLIRALVLATIPLAAVMGQLHVEHLVVVTLVISILTLLFDLSYQSYLPGLVGGDLILEGNSKLTASAAVAEFGGFSIGGWLVQVFTPPMAILIDALSFLVSAFSLGLIRAKESQVISEEHPNMRREIREGLVMVLRHPLLRASAAAILIQSLTQNIYGALVVLYMSRGLGFSPGVLGMIWAVGGISAFAAAALTPRITSRFGVGRTMITGLMVAGFAYLFIPLAEGATLLSVVLLILAQLGDGFFVAYEINIVSLRQSIADERMLGRVTATMRFFQLGAMLVGTLLGGLLGEWFGVRPVLLISALAAFLAVLPLVFSPIRHEK